MKSKFVRRDAYCRMKGLVGRIYGCLEAKLIVQVQHLVFMKEVLERLRSVYDVVAEVAYEGACRGPFLNTEPLGQTTARLCCCEKIVQSEG